MEHTATPTPDTTKRSTPWGLIIGTVLILAVVVFAAYYALSSRIALNASTSIVSVR